MAMITTFAAVAAAASLTLTVPPAGAAVIGDPGPGAPSAGACTGAARTAVAQAYARTRAKANGASLRVTETDTAAGTPVWTAVTDLDATTHTLRMRYHTGGPHMASLDATQTGTGAGPYTLTQRIGAGNVFTLGFPEQTVAQADRQAWALARLLHHDTLRAPSYTIPRDAAEVANGAALLKAPLDRSIDGDRFARLCLSAAKQRNGTTVYRTITGPARLYVTDATGILIRVSGATQYRGAAGRHTVDITWATPMIPTLPAGTVRAMDAEVDSAATIVLLPDVARALSSEIGSIASQTAAQLHRQLSVAELRTIGATFAHDTGSRYRLGDVFSAERTPGPIDLHLFGTGDHRHPFTVTPTAGGITVDVAAGVSRAGYGMRATPRGVTTAPLR